MIVVTTGDAVETEVDASDFVVVLAGVTLIEPTVDFNGVVDDKGDFVEIEVDFSCSVSCKVVELKVELLLLTVVLTVCVVD